jgi:hypothetical protein
LNLLKKSKAEADEDVANLQVFKQVFLNEDNEITKAAFGNMLTGLQADARA